MTDFAPDDGCRSRRCRQVGRCNCLHVNDDGTSVPGDGTAANPYRHTTPPITCIIDSNGTQLTPNSSKCITLPNSAAGIELADGTVLNPNINGIVVVPDSYLNEFTIVDSDGTALIVNDGAILNFDMDGGPTQGFVRAGYNHPTIVGTSVIFPAEKGIYVDQGNVLGGTAAATPFSVGAGAPAQVEIMSPQALPAFQKETNLRVSVGLGLALLAGTNLTPGPGEEIGYEIVVRLDNNPTLNLNEFVVSHGLWSPDNSRGYTHDTYVININTGGVLFDPSNPAVMSVVANRISDTLQPVRAVYAECQLAVQWV